jgi:protocatechuate 3,4-dioxygenase beta subunit
VAAGRLSPNGGGGRSDFVAKSDELGMFRIHSLQPGDYVIQARPETATTNDDRLHPGSEPAAGGVTVHLSAGQDAGPIELALATPPADAPSFQPLLAPSSSRSAALGPETGSLVGRVVRAVDGATVPNALVRQASVTTGAGTAIRADAAGQFEFAGLADGGYALMAQSPQMANARAGAFQSFRGARLASLKDGRQSSDVTLVVAQFMTIEGRILDEFGDPVAGVRPRLAVRGVIHGQAQLISMGDSSLDKKTDDLGRFRFSHLEAGDYYLEVISPPFFDSVEYPSGFVPTYYPGTDQATDATAIHVQVGVDIPDLVLPLIPATTTTIQGRVVEPSGLSFSKPRVQLLRMQKGVATSLALIEGAPNGSFSIDDVPPGTYVVYVGALASLEPSVLY